MYWKDLTSLEISKLERSLVVVLPLGAIEQHGKHLPTSTDFSIGGLFLERLHKQMEKDILILPGVAVTCSNHHLDFSGTLSVSHESLLCYLKDILGSVKKNGFKKIVVFNAHGGNQGLGQVLVESFGYQNQDTKIAFFSWWRIATQKLRDLNESGFMGVGHAGEFETSLMRVYDQRCVREDQIEKGKFGDFFPWEKGDLLQAPAVSSYKSMKQQTANGVYGDPHFSSLEKGEKIIEIVTEEMKKILTDF